MPEPSEFEATPSNQKLKNAPRFVLLIEQWLVGFAGLILLVTMAMTTLDVIGRYVLDRPLGFAYEVTELLMAAVFFVALSSVTLRGEHITIGVFNDFWKGRIGGARDFVIAAGVVICTAFLFYRMVLFTQKFLMFGDITNYLKFPLYPVAALGTIGVGLSALAGLVLAVDAARRMMGGAP